MLSQTEFTLADSCLIDVTRLAVELGAQACRLNVDAVAECGSTNAMLMQCLSGNSAELASGTVLIADRQTAGRGRRGRRWLSALRAPEDSLTLSLLWRFPRAHVMAGLSLAVGLAIRRAMAALGATGVRLKWPNDLLVEAPEGWAKVGGILIELSSSSTGTAAVIGIGLNLRTPDESVPDQRAAGLDALLDGSIPERHRLVAMILRHLVVTLDQFVAQGFTGLRAEWEAGHAFSGQQVRLLTESGPDVFGRCLGVDDEGVLLVDTGDGICRWMAGDVSLRSTNSGG